MCAICGCSPAEGHDHHHHDHDHAHGHDHSHSPFTQRTAGIKLTATDTYEARRVRVEQELLAKNARVAVLNREWLSARGTVAFNLVSSPGAGKTTLLERTVRELGREVVVVEGDQATSRDAERIRAAGARAVQVNTGVACHLDASMVERALGELAPERGAVVMIENVGNLVCPALFDLGERAKVLLASVTEGDDKPLKYPHMFRAARLVVLSKIDLLPYVPFDRDRFVEAVALVNPAARVIEVSATTGQGLAEWYAWIAAEIGGEA